MKLASSGISESSNDISMKMRPASAASKYYQSVSAWHETSISAAGIGSSGVAIVKAAIKQKISNINGIRLKGISRKWRQQKSGIVLP